MNAFHGTERPDFTPDYITELKPDEVFVFGSNLAGMHGGGAAYVAFRQFGAVMGCGVGLRGQSYAIPTMQGGVGENYLPERTFHNHREAILDTFGIEIKCDRSLGYYIANSDDLEGDGIRQWLLESLSLNNLLNESSDMRDRILFEKIPSAQRWLSTIVNAMRDGKMLRMTYKSFWRDEPKEYETHPYCLKLFKQRWYMLSKTEGKKEPRTYALDRILELEELPKALKLPKKFSAEGYFSNFFGIIADDTIPPSIVEIKVSADQVKYVESLPLHPSQKAVVETADYTLYQYRLVPTFDFKQEILSRGSTFEVMSPEWFRDEVKEEISAMYKNYGL